MDPHSFSSSSKGHTQIKEHYVSARVNLRHQLTTDQYVHCLVLVETCLSIQTIQFIRKLYTCIKRIVECAKLVLIISLKQDREERGGH